MSLANRSQRAVPAGARHGCGAALLAALGILASLSGARADEPEPLLFLGIQRSTTIDKLASQMVIEHLKERGENLIAGAPLSDTERRCRRQQCLAPLATQRKAALVLDGDVLQAGGNRSLRVVMHLYDSRKRQQQELDNLCTDCDETKLGIVLTNTTTDLLGQYRKTLATMDQLAALLDATPVGRDDRGQTAEAGTTTPPAPPAATPTPAPTPPPGLSLRDPAGTPAAGAQTQGPPTSAQTPAATAGPPVGAPGAYPTPLPPPPAWAQPDPAADSDRAPSRPAAKKGLSVKRKAIAGVTGALGGVALVGSIVMNVLDMRIASNRTINPSGSPCIDPQYAGQNCVYSTIRWWAPGYGLSALLLGSMILTLTLPEKESR